MNADAYNFVILQFDWSLQHVRIAHKNCAEFRVQVFDFNQTLWRSNRKHSVCLYILSGCINVKPKSPESETHTHIANESEKELHISVLCKPNFDQHNQYKATTSQMCIIAQKCSNKTSPHIYSHCLLSVIAVVASSISISINSSICSSRCRCCCCCCCNSIGNSNGNRST